jgi:hypothetical protein
MEETSRFYRINSELKSLITEYQKEGYFDFERFKSTHNSILELIGSYEVFSDLQFKFIDSYNHILNGNMDFLVKEPLNYHNLLWQLHHRLTMIDGNRLEKWELPIELAEFDKILKSEKIFLKEQDIYYILTKIGDAEGHLTSIRLSRDSIRIEYNDHSPSRTYLFKNLLEKKGWNCSEIKILREVFQKSETSDNLFFGASIEIKPEETRTWPEYLAEMFDAIIDIDWILLDSRKPYSREEMDNEIKILEAAFILFEIYKIKPKKTIDALDKLIVDALSALDKPAIKII